MSNIESVVDHCKILLNEYSGASKYLNYLDSRLNSESQNNFNFGYFPDSSNLELLFSSFSKEFLKNNSLIYKKEIYDSMGPRDVWESYFDHHPLIMPYKDVYGKIIAIVGRTLLSDEERKPLKISKYKNTIFKKGHHLFGLYEAKEAILQSDSVFVVEGQFDVIKAHERGLKNIVALGNSNMTDYQFGLLLRFTNNINLLLDNDEAGEKGRVKILEKYSKFANILNCYIEEPFKDADEFFTVHSELAFTLK